MRKSLAYLATHIHSLKSFCLPPLATTSTRWSHNLAKENHNATTTSRRGNHNGPSLDHPDFLEWCRKELTKDRRENLNRPEESVTLPTMKPPYVMFGDYPRKLIDCTSMDYLGFSTDDEVVMAYSKGLVEGGSTGRRRQTDGCLSEVIDLEKTIADYHGCDACFSFATSSEATSMLFHTLFEQDDVIFWDEYNNIFKRGSAQFVEYSHRNIADLKNRIQNECTTTQWKTVYTEGVFSQTGNIAPLQEIAEVCKRSNAQVIINDTHGIGVLGSNLKGTEEHCDSLGVSQLTTVSLDPVLGQFQGGYIVGSQEVIQQVREGYDVTGISTVDLSPAVVRALVCIFQKLPTMQNQVRELHRLTKILKAKLWDAGLPMVGGDHPTFAIPMGSERVAVQYATFLKETGVLATATRFPQVRKGDAHVTLSLTVNHREKHIEKMFEALVKVAKILKLIS